MSLRRTYSYSIHDPVLSAPTPASLCVLSETSFLRSFLVLIPIPGSFLLCHLLWKDCLLCGNVYTVFSTDWTLRGSNNIVFYQGCGPCKRTCGTYYIWDLSDLASLSLDFLDNRMPAVDASDEELHIVMWIDTIY